MKAIEIVGDSLIKDIQSYRMNEASGSPDEKIYVKSFPGATIDCMQSHICPTLKRNPSAIVIHCGTNDLRKPATAEDIAGEVLELANLTKTNDNRVLVSGIVPRGDRWQSKAIEVNYILKQLCYEQNFNFIDNNNISPLLHLNRSRLHLNREGTRILANNYLHALGF